MSNQPKIEPAAENRSRESAGAFPFEGFILASGNFFFRFRNALFPVVVLTVILFTRPALFLGSPTLDRVVAALGLAVALGGQCFRLLVIGFVYIKRGGKDGHIYAKNLVTEGFYAHTRNPMYVGNFMIALGMSMIYGAFEMYALVVPFFFFAYLSIVVAEERYLRERFGNEYDEYARSVNRFIPDLRGIRKSLASYRFDWKRALRKDYGTLYWTLAGICAVHLWKAYHVYGIDERRTYIFILATLIGFFSLSYLVVRHLKMTKRLR